MKKQEEEHLRIFNQLLHKYRVRPSLLLPVRACDLSLSLTQPQTHAQLRSPVATAATFFFSSASENSQLWGVAGWALGIKLGSIDGRK
jgi:hypothetical protein